MDFRRNGAMIEIGDAVRIEAGPVRRRGIATEELLSNDVTAGHYQVGAPDALGKPIVLGEIMDYVDWRSPARAYYLYSLDKVDTIKMTQGPKRGQTIDQPRWVLAGTYETEEAAISAGLALAK